VADVYGKVIIIVADPEVAAVVADCYWIIGPQSISAITNIVFFFLRRLGFGLGV